MGHQFGIALQNPNPIIDMIRYYATFLTISEKIFAYGRDFVAVSVFNPQRNAKLFAK